MDSVLEVSLHALTTLIQLTKSLLQALLNVPRTPKIEYGFHGT